MLSLRYSAVKVQVSVNAVCGPPSCCYTLLDFALTHWAILFSHISPACGSLDLWAIYSAPFRPAKVSHFARHTELWVEIRGCCEKAVAGGGGRGKQAGESRNRYWRFAKYCCVPRQAEFPRADWIISLFVCLSAIAFGQTPSAVRCRTHGCVYL